MAVKRVLSCALRAVQEPAFSPCAENLQPVIEALGRITPADLGLSNPTLPEGGPVLYLEVYENEQVSIGIFVLPPAARIPLHDHPRMSVLSRVVCGSVTVRSFDLPAPIDVDLPERLIATPREPVVVEAGTTTFLLPTIGNVHEFQAHPQHGCAILDVILPPYNPLDGRGCTYYDASGPAPTAEAPRVPGSPEPVLLVAVEPPDEFIVQRATYTGEDPLAASPTS